MKTTTLRAKVYQLKYLNTVISINERGTSLSGIINLWDSAGAIYIKADYLLG